jgi:dipeptidyl aminopeptidase/acylaminoacyl peptidase
VFGFDTAHEETAQQAPFFLPDGRRFLHDSTKKEREYVLASVSGDLHRPLFRTGSSPAQFVPSSSGGGWILYIVGGQLLARPFDPGKGVVTGGSIPVVDRLPLGPSWSASSNGVLAFRRASVELSRFNWAGRDGKFLDTIGAVGVAGLSTPRISPDQKAIAFSRTDDNGMSHLWLFDAARDTAARLTVESNRDEGPMWSANGAHILYLSVRGALTESASHFLVERPVNGAGPVTEIKIAAPTRPSGETHDGQILAAGPGGVVLLSRPDGARRIALIKGLNARESSISPDGRWLMYPSNVEGRTDVFVQPMPQESGGPANAAGKWQISGAGGDYPLWRRDGKEISYIAPDGKMMAVPVESGEGGFRPGKAQALFDSKLVSGDYGYRSVMREYDVSADGQRFLLNQPASDTTEMPITVIVNWPKLLQR